MALIESYIPVHKQTFLHNRKVVDLLVLERTDSPLHGAVFWSRLCLVTKSVRRRLGYSLSCRTVLQYPSTDPFRHLRRSHSLPDHLLCYKRLNEETFKDKYGGGVEDSNLDRAKDRWSIIVILASFFGRRIAFIASVIFLGFFLWAQLAIQIMISVFMIILLLTYWPL